MLATDGWAGFSVPAVSRRASISVPLLYRRFGTKEGLFLAAQAHGLRRTERLIADRLGSTAPAGPEDAVHAAVSAIAEVFAVHGPFLRALRDRAFVDARVREVGAASLREARDAFARHVLTAREWITHPDPVTATDVCFRVVSAASDQEAQLGGPVTTELNWDSVVAQLSQCCIAYLGVAPRLRRSAPGTVRPWPEAQAGTGDALDRLTSLAVERLAEHGYEALAVAEFSATADTSVGALYRLFGDKNQLVQAAERRALERLVADAQWQFPSDLEPAPLVDALGRAVSRLSAVVGRHRAAVRVLSSRRPGAQVESWSAATIACLRDLFVAALGADPQSPRAKEAMALSFRIVFAALTEWAVLGKEFEHGMAPATHPEYLTELAGLSAEHIRRVEGET